MLNSANGFTGLIDVPADYQAHHLIPQQLSQNSFLKQLGGLVDLNDFATNGIALPRDVATALSGGQTPHLGSHPAYTSFIQNLLDTATSPYDPSVPLTPAESTELAGRVNSIQAYSRMAMSGLLPDSAATPGGRLPLNARDPMIPSNDPADVRAYFQQLQSDLQSKGFTTPESLDRLVDFPRYELLNQANAFDPNLTAAQRGDLARNVDDVRASLDASGRTDLTSGLNDAGRGRYTLSGSTQSSAPASAPAGASPELLQGVESATGRSLATGLTAPESLGTIGSSELAPLNTVAPRDVATLPQIEQPALLPDAAPIIRDNSTIPTIQDNPIVQNDPIVQDNQASVRNTITDMPETRAPGIAEVPETGTVLPETTAPSELPSTSPAAREGAPVADTPRAPVSSELADVPRAPVSEAPAEITGAATGRFTPNFVGVISQSPTASKIFTGAGVLGAAGLAADAGITGYNAYQLYNQGDTLGAGHEVAGFGGRLSGSLTGAYLLGEAGAFGGPWGALGGAIVGGIGGAILGDKGVKTLYDSLTGYQPPTATSSPGWPDQFAAEFDQNNGGAPFSDPMTGFQAESQADYDARRQSYVDSKMADQASQGQQLMDSLRLMPGVDSNALAQNPAVGAPAAASPTPPAVDAQNGLDGANATAPLPAVESVQPAPIDSAPAEMSAPSLTSTEFAPPTLPDQPSGFGATLPSFNLSTTPATEQPLPAAPEPAALPAAIDPAPAEMSAPSLTSAEFAPPTLPDQPSGFTPTMPSFDLNSGFNTGLNSGLDTGIGSFNSGINSGFNSGLNSSFNSGINSSFDSGINSSFDSGINSSFNSGINSSFDSGINSSFDSGLNSSFNSGINSSFDSGSSSSSSLSDFGDSSFSSSSFGGDMGGDMGPVVLDLADQGIHLTDLRASQANFDADGNGVPNRIAWTIPGEGLLAFDANSSGTVDQTRELALRQWTPGAQTDLQGLVGFDTNHDDALDAADRDFGQFDIWRDNNSNGVSDPGELSSLVAAGVASISLASDGLRSNLPDGSTIYGQGSFTRTDGSSGRLADVALAFAPDIGVMRDQLVGAMAAGKGGAPGTPPPVLAPAAGVGPLLGADPAPSLHAKLG